MTMIATLQAKVISHTNRKPAEGTEILIVHGLNTAALQVTPIENPQRVLKWQVREQIARMRNESHQSKTRRGY